MFLKVIIHTDGTGSTQNVKTRIYKNKYQHHKHVNQELWLKNVIWNGMTVCNLEVGGTTQISKQNLKSTKFSTVKQGCRMYARSDSYTGMFEGPKLVQWQCLETKILSESRLVLQQNTMWKQYRQVCWEQIIWMLLCWGPHHISEYMLQRPQWLEFIYGFARTTFAL
jgi:hypothetical protein